MTTLLAVLVGGFAGAIARQEGFSAIQERARTRFPVGILAVNLSGAFVLGLLFGLGVASAWPHWIAAGVETGFIGAYTTYSTFMFESDALLRNGSELKAMTNLIGSAIVGLVAVRAGIWLGTR